MPFSSHMIERLGRAQITPAGPFEAGSYAHLTITYTAGFFGIDDTGGLKFSWRTVSDSGRPQFLDPTAPNYTTAHATNGAKLEVEYNRNNIRPWVNTIFIRVKNGYLRDGDQIILKIGDPSQGSRGYRLQTCCDDDFEFKVFVDAFATYDFAPLLRPVTLRLVPGPPVRWRAHVPTLRCLSDRFRLAVVPEDRWGNPTDRAEQDLVLKPSLPVDGLPDRLSFRIGDGPRIIDDIRLESTGDLWIELTTPDGASLGRSNPLHVVQKTLLQHYWGDLHGQSNETVGTNTVQQYFAFARDRAFLDMVAHQGNDFQVSDALWAEINRLTASYDEPDKFVALPAYEWSGNTALGGDRNVYYAMEGRPIHRSSRVLLNEDEARDRICPTANDLFEALKCENAVVFAHVGGRYADLSVGHDARLERSVEIHSCWGTFEWILHDAFDLGHRVGLVCHSDDHKGRPGAAYPGASSFGAIGGLTCYQMTKLDRKSLFKAIRNRHHYGTTGTRLYLNVEGRFERDEERFEEDPRLGPTQCTRVRQAGMGDIVRCSDEKVELAVEVVGSAPLERVTVFNGKTPVAVRRGHDAGDLGRRIRVLWEGAERRGRSRNVHWRGHCRLHGNRFERVRSFNFFNVDRPLLLAADGSQVELDSTTTGNFAGFDMWLCDKSAGDLVFISHEVQAHLSISTIQLEDQIFEGGGLGKRVRMFRLPDEGKVWHLQFTEHIKLRSGVDNPIYVRVTQEDGHQAWSSPLYLVR